jgi:Flp pilus assembly protein TadD
MNVDLPPPLDQVAALCEQGRLDEAAAICRRTLQDSPRHGEALQLLGLIALQRGDAAEAVRLIGEAVAAAPREARYRINLSAVLGQATRSCAELTGDLTIDDDSVVRHRDETQ